MGRAQATTHDDRVGIDQHARAARRLMRPRLSPTFDLQQRVDPGSGELLADPLAVGVGDLTEQQFGPDRHDVAAHGQTVALGRRRQVRTGGRSARYTYCPPLISASATEIHSRPFHSHFASSAVGGMMAKPTASCCTNVFHLAILLAGTLMPLAPTNVRYRLISSLARP